MLKRLSKHACIFIITTGLALTGCGTSGSNTGLLVALFALFGGTPVSTDAPVLNNLAIPASDNSSITLTQPTYANTPDPVPTVVAYIGLQTDITVTGSIVANFIQGNIDVSGGDYTFSGLSANNYFTIVVVAQNSVGYDVKQINGSTNAAAPVLNDLSITASGTTSMTLATPTFSTAGVPAPQVDAYIGDVWTMSVSGQTVSGHDQGPVDASGGYAFIGLSVNTTYRIIVIAHNASGYSIKMIQQGTSGIAPVLNGLSITGTDASTMTLAMPTLSAAGNPLPEVNAYIGLDGTIGVAGAIVTDYEQGPIDVSAGGYQFSGLSDSTIYRIIVVASNIYGPSSQQIVQSTGGIAPVLRSLAITDTTSGTVTLAQPKLSTAGNPAPGVTAYIGLPGGVTPITVTGATVTNNIGVTHNVTAAGCTFNGLAINTSYRIIVVAQNSAGYSVQQIDQSTGAVAPVLSGGVGVTGTTTTTMTISGPPAFSIGGNPTPTVEAYIGPSGTISISGSTVSGFSQGPVNVSMAGCTFSGLSPDTAYRIYVVAHNSAGYSVLGPVNQSTGLTPPALNALSVTGFDASNITLAQPAFSTAGNPLPAVMAYIGLNGALAIDGNGNVTGQLAVGGGPYDVNDSGHTFTGLTLGTTYQIRVVAKNGSTSFDYEDIVSSTAGSNLVPILHDLGITTHDTVSITLGAPTFHQVGVPAATVDAYIGADGAISVSGSAVSGASASQLPFTGAAFGGLSPGTAYRIIVVAHNAAGYSVRQIVQSTGAIAPMMNDISISSTDTGSITVAAPGFAVAGNPTPTVTYYLGTNGGASPISVAGSVVSDYTATNATGSFTGLGAGTEYRVIVVARNEQGYSVKQIVQRTGAVAPVLNDLSVSSFDAVSIALAQPTFSTAGYPLPTTVTFYIGLNGGATPLSIKGSVVSNSLSSNFTGSFAALTANTEYRIIAVAQNATGYSVRQIVQRTTGAGAAVPVMNDLIVSTFESGITVDFFELERPTLTTAGAPSPTTVLAYFGEDGVMSWDGSNVTGTVLTGPVDVSTGGYQFLRPAASLTYKIIVVAENTTGASEQEIILGPSSTAPVLNTPLSIASYGSDCIELMQPTLSTVGNPAPTVRAWIGTASGGGAITYNSGSHSVTNQIEGPIDVSTGGYQFKTSLNPYTDYRIIVVAENTVDADEADIVRQTRGIAPVLNAASVFAFTSSAITLNAPTLVAGTGIPTPTTEAYIGEPAVITYDGSGSFSGVVQTVTSTDGWQFTGLTPYHTYQIYVKSWNVEGYSIVGPINQQTRGIAPVLAPASLVVSSYTSTTITMPAATYTTTPVPAGTVRAYIGPQGGITYNGDGTFTGSTANIDVSIGGTFNGLAEYTGYDIFVLATNNDGYTDSRSVLGPVTQTTSRVPVLNPISLADVVLSYDVRLDMSTPTLATDGIPGPTTVLAYIGDDGGASPISVDVNGNVTNADEGPIDVSADGASYTFNGTISWWLTTKRVIVVAENAVGDVDILQDTEYVDF